MLERIVLGILTTLLSINVWTGFPILALWVGSRFVGSSGLSMLAVVIVLAVLVALVSAGLYALLWLNQRYNQVTGRPPPPRQPAPWLRSMRAEGPAIRRQGHQTSAVERIAIVTVVLAVIAFEIWFFFFAGSSLPRNA